MGGVNPVDQALSRTNNALLGYYDLIICYSLCWSLGSPPVVAQTVPPIPWPFEAVAGYI